jgi:hypothetical protein
MSIDRDDPDIPVSIGHFISSTFDELTVNELEWFEKLELKDRLLLAGVLSISVELGRIAELLQAASQEIEKPK